MGLTDWQKHCVHEIANGLIEYEAQQACLGEVLDIAKCKVWISKNKYPFGTRENHPYLVWRQEMVILGEFLAIGRAAKEYPAWRNFYKAPRKKSNRSAKPKNLPVCPGQLSLFDL